MTVLAVLQLIAGAVWVLFAILLGAFVLLSSSPSTTHSLAVLGVGGLCGLGSYHIICGLGLWRLRRYGRIMLIIVAGVGLFAMPWGTILSIVILVYLFRRGVRVLFSGKTADELDLADTAAVQAIRSSDRAATVVIAVVFVATATVKIVSVGMPGLWRARIAGNEASAIGTLRAISTAETTYATTANGGYYDSQNCLVHPERCVPAFRGTAFLAEEYRTSSGYSFDLSGEPLGESKPRTSPSSLKHFVVIGTPISPSTGTRVFCVDDSGVFRSTGEGSAVPVKPTSCPASWAVLP